MSASHGNDRKETESSHVCVAAVATMRMCRRLCVHGGALIVGHGNHYFYCSTAKRVAAASSTKVIPQKWGKAMSARPLHD